MKENLHQGRQALQARVRIPRAAESRVSNVVEGK